MKRNIIEIDEKKCTGCGLCITGCPEGAIELVNGKAKLVKESYCDGLGACLGDCPEGAITVIEKDVESYNEESVMGNIIHKGADVIEQHLKHLEVHEQHAYLKQAKDFLMKHEQETKLARCNDSNASCPGSMHMTLACDGDTKSASESFPARASALTHWPIQLHLVDPHAACFQDADLLLAADCVPFAYNNFHEAFLENKRLIILCPKLDNAYSQYVEKLFALIRDNAIRSITVVHMEVPCCMGVMKIVKDALVLSKKK